MPAPNIDAPPQSPDPLDPRTFATRGVVFARWLATFRTQLVAALDYIDTTIAPLAGSVAGAAASASDAAISAGQAQAERLLAQALAEAAQVSANVYDTIAEGRAAVADGEYFKVIAEGSDELESLTLFRRDSDSTQTVIMTFVSGDDFDAAADARIAVAIGDSVQAHSANLDAFAARTIDTDVTLAADSDDRIATQKAVRAFAEAAAAAAAAALVDSSPGTLDTLNELAAALGDDPNYAATTATALGNRVRVDTPAQGLNGTQKSNAKTNLDLQNVTNTSDANKPVSTAQQAALDVKLAHTGGELTDYRIKFVDRGNSGAGTVTLNWSAGNVQRVARTGAFTLAFSNFPPSGTYGEMKIEAVNWGAGAWTSPTIYWVLPNGSYTTSFATYGVALQASGTDAIYLETRDGGTTLIGRVGR